MGPMLVTGGTGTLGRPIVRRLRDAGHEVRVVSRRTGVDLRDMNIAQARFLADVYGIANVAFHASDANALGSDQYDVVLM